MFLGTDEKSNKIGIGSKHGHEMDRNTIAVEVPFNITKNNNGISCDLELVTLMFNFYLGIMKTGSYAKSNYRKLF